MTEMKVVDPAIGTSKASMEIAKILQRLNYHGFTNPVAYGAGLSDYLIGKDGGPDIEIRADMPDIKPAFISIPGKTHSVLEQLDGRLSQVTLATGLCNYTGSKSAIPYYDANLMIVESRVTRPESVPFLGNDNPDDIDRAMKLSMQFFKVSDADLTATFQAEFPRTPLQIVKAQPACIDQIAMHYDARENSVLTTYSDRESVWRKHAEARTFAIPHDTHPVSKRLDVGKVNRALKSYFDHMAEGRDLQITFDSAGEYARLLYDATAIAAVSKCYEPLSDGDTITPRASYEARADFVGRLIDFQ